MPMRPSREALHMQAAFDWSLRSVCKRDQGQNGCIITTQDLRQVLAIGYNGPARGLEHERCRNSPGTCGCVHAEANAIAAVDGRTLHKTAFCTSCPCELCAQLLINANVSKVYYVRPYRNDMGLEILKQVLQERLVKMPLEAMWQDKPPRYMAM